MAMNIPSNIRQVRGTSAQVQNISAAAGSLFYDTDRELFLYSAKTGNKIFTRAGAIDTRLELYVDAENGSDNNNGFSKEAPLKSLDKAVYLLNTVHNVQRDCIINLSAGTYSISSSIFPRYTSIIGDSADTTIIDTDYIEVTNRNIILRNLAINCNSGENANGFVNFYGGHIQLYDVNININIFANNSVGSIVSVTDNGFLFIGSCNINGNNNQVFGVIYPRYGATVNISSAGNAHVSNVNTIGGTVCCIAGGLFNMDGTMSSSGNVVGRRYCIYAGGQIQSRGKGTNAIPGTVEGYVEPNVGAAYY